MTGPSRFPDREQEVTVCVAAIAQGMVFGASDRMITLPDVEYEPASPKIFRLTNSITLMIAGDSAWQMEIALKLGTEAAHHVQNKPDEWLMLAYMARRYMDGFAELWKRQAETMLLGPLGLDYQSFYDRQKDLAPHFVTRIVDEITYLPVPEVEALIVGVDPLGPHIFSCDKRSGIVCHDMAGYASIGVGSAHADFQFMQARHSPAGAIEEALWLTYMAKRRAEVAPGVGEETDMFWIGAPLGVNGAIEQEQLLTLEKIYKGTRESEKKSSTRAQDKVTAYLEKLAARVQAAQQAEAKAAPSGDANDKSNPRGV